MRDDQRHIPVTIRMNEPRRYKHGGLAAHADKVRDAGRFGDDMIVHVNRDEFEEMRRAWGEPTINPKTGAPEYFLGGLRKWFQENPIASAVLPAAASIIAPGLGSTVGNLVNVGNIFGNYAGTVGNALVGAGLGALTGGGQGALIGGVSGAAAPYLMSGVSSLFGGSGLGEGAGSGMRDSNMRTTDGVTGGNAGSGGSSGSGPLGGLSLSRMTSSPENMMKAILGIGTIASAFAPKKADPNLEAAQQRADASQAQFNKPLPQVDFNRRRVGYSADPTKYGMGPGVNYFENNAVPTVQAAEGGEISTARYPMRSERTVYEQAHAKLRQADDARRPPVRETPGMRDVRTWRSMEAVRAGEETGYAGGGLSKASRYVQGPGTGRTDEIPALLSDGEYVIDAETVAMLGDGSNKAGAQRLDQMREQIRSHKGKALARGKFSPNAKPALSYLKKAR